jgi:hypothetical protein
MIPQATTELEAQTSRKAIKLSNLLGARKTIACDSTAEIRMSRTQIRKKTAGS